MKKILNTWTSKVERPEYYHVGEPLFTIGEYAVYKQFENRHLYTFKNVAISQLVGLNKELLVRLHNDERPEGKYTPQTFLFDRAKESLTRGINYLKSL